MSITLTNDQIEEFKKNMNNYFKITIEIKDDTIRVNYETDDKEIPALLIAIHAETLLSFALKECQNSISFNF